MASTMTREQFIEELGITPEDLVRESREFRANVKFLIDHRDQLRAEYLDRWIGIAEGSVVAHDETIDEVLDQIDMQGLDRRMAVLEHFPVEEPSLILRGFRYLQDVAVPGP
jgi:hypothetical protein